MFHVFLALPVNLTDSALFLLLCPIADMYFVELLDEAMLHYVALQGFVVGINAVWDFAVQSLQGSTNNFCWLFTDELFKRYVQHKHAIVANTIPKRHNAYVQNLNVAGYPQSVNRFAASEEGGSHSCSSVVQNSPSQPQARGVGQSPA